MAELFNITEALTGKPSLAMADPSNQTIRQPMWYENPALANTIPGIASVGAMLSGSPAQLPPTEGATPVEGLADPIASISGLLAPLAKAYLSRQAAVRPLGKFDLASSQRGSIPANEGESTMDALKRMFVKRGGVDKELTPDDFAENLKNKADRAAARAEPTPPPVEIAQPKTVLEKAISVLDDYHAISKDALKEDFTKRYGSLSDSTLNKVWKSFIDKEMIDAEPGVGKGVYSKDSHKINHHKLGD